jgi:hypothetical protein
MVYGKAVDSAAPTLIAEQAPAAVSAVIIAVTAAVNFFIRFFFM